jgi:hypothetical protein
VASKTPRWRFRLQCCNILHRQTSPLNLANSRTCACDIDLAAGFDHDGEMDSFEWFPSLGGRRERMEESM